MNILPGAFDHIFYYSNYEDLNNKIGNNIDLLKEHYLNWGRYENRQYCRLPENFDWKKFVNSTIITKDEAIYEFVRKFKEDLTIYPIINPKPKCIIIVYYIFINDEKDWRSIIREQMTDVYNSGIFSQSVLHVVLSGKSIYREIVYEIIKKIIQEDFSMTHIEENYFEFPAIQKIHELAMINKEKIFIYLHTKGMVNNNPYSWRLIMEHKLTLNTFLDWETTLYMFEKYKNIQKASLFPSIEGFAWYNFWWARGSYLSDCKPLVYSENRFECEYWLGTHGSHTWTDCYSIYGKNISYFHQKEMPTLIYHHMYPRLEIPLMY
jgi:hypothetical protein